MLLTGEAGTGKTALLERLGDLLTQESIEFALMLHPKVTVNGFYEFLAYDLSLDCPHPSQEAVLKVLGSFLQRQAALTRTTVLLVDDAHELAPDVLEELCLLNNLQNPQGKLLQVILAAQPQFSLRLAAGVLGGIKQRLTVRCHLHPAPSRRL
jgi:general secretion pathway protein A